MNKDFLLKILMGLLFVVVGASILFAILFAIAYSRLVGEEVRVRNTWTQIASVLKERLHVVQELIQTLTNVANSDERKILKEATDIVNILMKMDPSPEIVHESGKFKIFDESQSQLTLIIRRLVELKANHLNLLHDHDFLLNQLKLENSENRLLTESRVYNDIAMDFNKIVSIFPVSFIAGVMNFQKKAIFTKIISVGSQPEKAV